ncbi:DUF3597 domain-containing protein [Sphingorhabdus sp.]|uniref:DUF3597 domain-containing protein n=1 Tax=Sphingorhabdus sp. TaxID=1902408 RepID=UPI00391D8E54
MSIFSSIKDAVFGKKGPAAAPKTSSIIPAEIVAVAPQPVEDETVSDVDVIANLEAIDASDGRNLNWRSSIVDLMKMLGMESSLQERKDLAMELGYTGSLDGSAEMNMWLHKAVMRELAKNGGKVPAELLD